MNEWINTLIWQNCHCNIVFYWTAQEKKTQPCQHVGTEMCVRVLLSVRRICSYLRINPRSEKIHECHNLSKIFVSPTYDTHLLFSLSNVKTVVNIYDNFPELKIKVALKSLCLLNLQSKPQKWLVILFACTLITRVNFLNFNLKKKSGYCNQG